MLQSLRIPDSSREQLLIDAREAARRLSISPRSLWSLTKQGVIPHVRINRRVLYAPSDLAELVDQQRRGGEQA